MHDELIQFNSGDHVLGNKNVAEAVIIDGESIHATYDLDVLTSIVAETVSVNGNLFVKGNIEADEIICRGSFYCTGEIRVNKCNFGDYSMIGSVIGKDVYAEGDLFIKTTIDTDSSLEVDGLVNTSSPVVTNT